MLDEEWWASKSGGAPLALDGYEADTLDSAHVPKNRLRKILLRTPERQASTRWRAR
jgi:hypothetical protein